MKADPGSSDDAILLFHTGGTTGKPKGVTLSNRNMLSNTACAVEDYRMEQGCSFIILGPLFHLAAGARVFNCAALYGRGAVLSQFDTVNALESIERYRIDSATFVPTMVQMLLDHPEYAAYDLSSLKIGPNRNNNNLTGIAPTGLVQMSPGMHVRIDNNPTRFENFANLDSLSLEGLV